MNSAGKSPCIIDETADVALAAQRIAWGKLLNAGQTCVAPDYVLIHETMLHSFAREYAAAVRRMYGEEPMQNPEYGKIINEKHMERLKGLLQRGTPVIGGTFSDRDRKIAPPLLTGVSWDSPVMQEEIFGPILPCCLIAAFRKRSRRSAGVRNHWPCISLPTTATTSAAHCVR